LRYATDTSESILSSVITNGSDEINKYNVEGNDKINEYFNKNIV
jgi:hypothetical protein